MNNVVLSGRLTKDPEVRYTTGNNPTAVARFTLAVDRRIKEKETDFISCVAFGKTAEFLEKYMSKGRKIIVGGHIQTGSYKNREGKAVFTTDVICDAVEFADSKSEAVEKTTPVETTPVETGFVNVVEDGELPFN